ncbi:MAG: hypothetical protein JNL96_28595 [Planctomycetaceae bacterium]|nr:hypothetical protein [Planctomycetaceae bacterium]
MAQRRSYQSNRRHSSPRAAAAAPPPTPRPVKQPPKQYGKPFILLEDEKKNTFEFQGGSWVAYPRSVAECRIDCDVKELSQKVNRMTRYEVRLPIEG